MKLGKLAARHDPRVPHLFKHMQMQIPAASMDWTKPVKQWGMCANDRYGCCTAAAIEHLEILWLANTGFDYQPTDEVTLALYAATSDFPKADDGAVETTVLQYLVKNGLPNCVGNDKFAYATLNPKNLDELKLSIQYLGGAYIGVELPITAQTQDDEWDVVPGASAEIAGPNTWGGHSVCLVAYDETTFTCVTWGKTLKITNAFMQEYVDEAYGIVAGSWVANSGISPPGLNMAGLMAEMKAIQD
jgi:hypothetical protein